jgi:hypothetical protein
MNEQMRLEMQVRDGLTWSGRCWVAQPKRTILEFRPWPLHIGRRFAFASFGCACVGSRIHAL